MKWIVLISLGLSGCSLPISDQQISTAQPTHARINESALQLVREWRKKFTEEANVAQPNEEGTVAGSLHERVRLEQAARRNLPDRSNSDLSDTDWAAANAVIWQEIREMDADNTTFLKSVLPTDGWFRFGRDGEKVGRDAWLIVQHSPDQAFQREILRAMTPMVANGDASGTQYALLYDRVAMYEGKVQRYGSQIVCNNGHFEVSPVEDREKLDELRASVGLEPIADYLKYWDGKTC